MIWKKRDKNKSSLRDSVLRYYLSRFKVQYKEINNREIAVSFISFLYMGTKLAFRSLDLNYVSVKAFLGARITRAEMRREGSLLTGILQRSASNFPFTFGRPSDPHSPAWKDGPLTVSLG